MFVITPAMLICQENCIIPWLSAHSYSWLKYARILFTVPTKMLDQNTIMKNILKHTQEIFKPDGLLSKLLDSYEPRDGQLGMASAVAKILGGGKLVVEAETGIGKTLAYLIPAVLSRQKAVISTNTLNLQEQILRSEIPFIQEHIDPELSALCVKGRQNYLCLYRWHQFALHPQLEMFASDATRKKIAHWLKSTTSGDRAELDWLEDNSPLWREISATASQCLGNNCPNEKTCFITELRRKAGSARLLIVNHHLFFSDLALRRDGYGEVLPRYEVVIFDEAHHLENVATNFFGFTVSHFQMIDLAKDVKLAVSLLPEDKQERISQAADVLHIRSEHFAAIFPAQPGKYPLQEFIEQRPEWEQEIQAVSDGLSGLESSLLAMAVEGETFQALASRCQELQSRLLAIAGLLEIPREETYIRWYERREKTLVLTASPIDIALELNSILYPNVRSTVFTSGTLTVGGDFSYFLARLGLDRDTETLSLKSPFDYHSHTMLYVPAHTSGKPFPQPDQKAFPEKIQEAIYQILLASSGRALVLFTSISSMRKTYPFLVENLPYPVFIQGQAPRHKLLESFQDQTNSVLLAVASFWEGINVPGESLSCVIIDKLPFEVPSDPVIMARINKIREEGGNPFMDFQLPRAILTLRQGVGRLMRTSTDNGLLAILDVRLFTKQYGRLFFRSLPPSPVTREITDVVSFFAKNK
jgi:ATP-dependent DNA helicase DinG